MPVSAEISKVVEIPEINPDEEFAASESSHMSDNDAKIVGQELLKMRGEKIDITIEAVVKRASDLKSPLHKFFEWNDTSAADRWRRHQARFLLKSIVIVKRPFSAPPVTERAVYAVTISDSISDGVSKPHKYVSAEEVKTDPQALCHMRDVAWKELLAWSRRYAQFNFAEFKSVFEFCKRYDDVD